MQNKLDPTSQWGNLSKIVQHSHQQEKYFLEVLTHWPIRILTNATTKYEGVYGEQSPGLNEGHEAGGDPSYDEGQVVDEQAVGPGTVGYPPGDDTSKRVGDTQQLQKR